MKKEEIIQKAAELVRVRGHQGVSTQTLDAKIDADSDGDGVLDDNPDTGSGSAPGRHVVAIDDVVVMSEDDVEDDATILSVYDDLSRGLEFPEVSDVVLGENVVRGIAMAWMEGIDIGWRHDENGVVTVMGAGRSIASAELNAAESVSASYRILTGQGGA